MKANSKYNRSEIMKRAWEMFNNYNGSFSFSECLIDSWVIEKDKINNTPLFVNENVKEIFNQLDSHDYGWNHILDTVINKSNGYQKDIAEKGLKYNRLSEKQAWSIAYEYKKVA